MTTKLLCSFLLCVVSATAKHPLLVLAASKMPDQKQKQTQTQTQAKVHVDDDDDTLHILPPPHLQTHPLLQVPCAIQLVGEKKRTPLSTFVDTGAQVSVLSVEAAAKAGVLQMMDRRYAGHAQGVGQCRVLGRLPAGILLLHMHGERPIESPAVTILEHTNDGVDLLLGLDFLRDHGAILNLRTEEMTLQVKGNSNREVSIPFIRPRSALDFGGGGGAEGGDCYKDGRPCMSMSEANTDDEDAFEKEVHKVDMSGV
mmetsp:Transcript_8550/g.14206  ORF Transcript_8550/g.14206 Transcript_8550/m.14206 type:complete len:256 (-) Transcript_8550:242-1009(-)|eukprot:CAMPEP_0119005100 /NCGR_PEP_ID=MMETSP1176-20130426/1527_1 /TAXON_ID=265551 /ORGANISM="Synedropsis recta cf, Strain CCMP1620" /LENGTH=255 /DNA_ID=CAMNT_0006956869 /DNA_START=45 /DNA_END=812 /DNA_ORIENTATION=+